MPSQFNTRPADRALCSRETRLPGLPAILDAPALATAAGLAGLRQAYLRYKPGTSCVAGLIPAAVGLDAWAAMTYPEERWAEVRSRPKWNQGRVRARFLDEVPAVLVPLALERRLRAARALNDPVGRARLLSSLDLEDCALTLLRYKPGRRIVLRADDVTGPRAVVKLHASETAFACATAGAAHAAHHGGPALIAVSHDHRAVAVAYAPGHTLSADADPGDFAMTGATLAMLHKRTPGGDLPALRVAEAQVAIHAVRALAPELVSMAHRVAACLPDLPPGPAVPVHGDLSADQIVIGAAGAVLVDWDRAAMGSAARDLGSTLARLDLDTLRGTETATAADALLDGYAAVSALPASSEIAAHRAHAMLALATEGFRDRRPDWDVETAAVLRCVGALCGTRPPRAGLPRLPSLDRAADAQHMGAALSALRTGTQPDKPVKVSITRVKPGRRAQLRYELPDGRILLGKLRTKGPDRHTPLHQKRLRQAGLDGTDGVGVPDVAAKLDDPAVWLQQAVPGCPLGTLLDGGSAGAVDAMQRTGRALAVLHEMPPQTDRHWTRADELDVLGRALAHSPCADLYTLTKRLLTELPPMPLVGLHRDFYFDQVLIAPDTIWLVDLDLYAQGDPCVDLGNFLAHLTELALRRGMNPNYHDPLGNAFLGGYAEHRALPPASHIDTYHSISLARHVTIAERFPDRRAAVPSLIALCRDRLTAQRALVRAAM